MTDSLRHIMHQQAPEDVQDSSNDGSIPPDPCMPSSTPRSAMHPRARSHLFPKLTRTMRAIQPLALVVPPAIMLLWAWLRLPSAALVTSACAAAGLLPFFVDLESWGRRARDLMPVVVMTSLAVAGRLVFAPVPAVKPVTALIIMAGLGFGREVGFVTGALTMLMSNVFFGQGPWTPWQMYAMGLVGYLSGAMAGHGLLSHRWAVGAFGFGMAALYGLILDTWTLVGFVADSSTASTLATYAAGLPANLASAIGTVAFLIPISRAWPRMFQRIRDTYHIGCGA